MLFAIIGDMLFFLKIKLEQMKQKKKKVTGISLTRLHTPSILFIGPITLAHLERSS